MTEVREQEKFGFTAQVDGVSKDYAPFDTAEAAGKTKQALESVGIVVGDVKIVYTVASARSLVAARRATVTPVADQPPTAEVAVIDPATSDPEPTPDATQEPAPRRGRRASK